MINNTCNATTSTCAYLNSNDQSKDRNLKALAYIAITLFLVLLICLWKFLTTLARQNRTISENEINYRRNEVDTLETLPVYRSKGKFDMRLIGLEYSEPPSFATNEVRQPSRSHSRSTSRVLLPAEDGRSRSSTLFTVSDSRSDVIK
jgi:hypothetical protein